MSKVLKPGENTGSDGGIFQEVGPRGGRKENFTTIPDQPHSTTCFHTWKCVAAGETHTG